MMFSLPWIIGVYFFLKWYLNPYETTKDMITDVYTKTIARTTSESTAQQDLPMQPILRQDPVFPSETTVQEKNDSITALKEYKSLLDMGVITQEEFDAKKKQLLGL